MLGNWIRCTHNGTGGTGNLTLVDVSGFPGFDNVFAGTRWVRYTIDEYTDSTFATLKQSETGIGAINTSTLVLTRTSIKSTWNGTTYLPNPGSATAPTAISFGNTAASIQIMCSPVAGSLLPSIPAVAAAATNLADGVGLPGLGVSVSSSNFSLTSGIVYYFPVLIMHEGPFSQASVRVVGVTTGGTPTLSVAIYEVDLTNAGLPGKKLADFGSLGVTTTAATITSAALSTPVYLAPGWYYVAVLYIANSASGTPTVRAMTGLTRSEERRV